MAARARAEGFADRVVESRPRRSMVDEPRGPAAEQISELLALWNAQDPSARDRLVPLIYEELRRLAHHYMRGERSGHTLQTTALVNEMYLRLSGLDRMQWRDRAHFMA